MAIEYRYFGILSLGDTPDDPAGVLRVWTDENGRQLEETFVSSLKWERTVHLEPGTRPDDRDYVEIDASVAEKVVQRRTQEVKAAQYRTKPDVP